MTIEGLQKRMTEEEKVKNAAHEEYLRAGLNQAKQEDACGYATLGLDTDCQPNAKPRHRLADRLQDEIKYLAERSQRLHKLDGLRELLIKNPETARILELMKELGI